MSAGPSNSLVKVAIGLLVVVAIGVAAFAVLRLESLTGPPDSFKLDLAEQLVIDESLIHYRLELELPAQLDDVHAVAVGLEDRV